MVDPNQLQTADFALLQQARALWAQRRWDAALEQFAQALQAQPDNVRAMIEFARALGQRYEIGRAEGLLQRATALAGSNPQVAPLIAQSYRLVHRPWQAIEALERLRVADALPAPLLGELAVLYEQTNQLDLALAVINQCVEQVSGQAEPKLVLARIQRLRGELPVAESLLRELLSEPDAAPLLRVRVAAELCHLRDETGDYDAAVAAIEQAKQILRDSPQVQELSRRAELLNQTFRQLYAELDEATIGLWRDTPLPSDPRCAGIAHLLGFPRSGTTLLEQLLEAHPQLVSSPERAVFSKDIFPAMYRVRGDEPLSLEALRAIPAERLQQQRQRYLDYMEALLGDPLAGRVHLDKNPNHTSLIVGLFRLFPESRFLCSVRDPRDVIVSAYLHFFPMTEFSASLLTWQSTCRQYAHEIRVWLAVRDLIGDGCLQVRYEDVVREPQAECQRALAFLGLQGQGEPDDHPQRVRHKIVNSPSQAAVRKPIYRGAIGRWKNYRRYLEPHLPHLEAFCQAFGYA
jgi:tetratricopeptide (TPR) repeat protein